MCDDIASSETPDSIHGRSNSKQAWLIVNLASKLSTQLNTKSTFVVLSLLIPEVFSDDKKISKDSSFEMLISKHSTSTSGLISFKIILEASDFFKPQCSGL